MNPRKKFYSLLIILALTAFATSCATTKANKFIDEGNAAVKDGEKLAQDADAQLTKLGEGRANFPANRDELKGTAQEAIDLLDKAIAKLREGATKFDEGSKTNLDAPLKEYLSLKSQEFSKHAEHLEVLKDLPKAFMDPSVQDNAALDARFAPIKERVEKLQQEWTDLATRADKIQEQNKDKFKS
ncbi:MAG: hypothetical protein QOC96_236 [Acidobacteriota bacterium]|jgi:uncharacterized protein YukE|nr:hypothetical protein [Acidobacteriota bacterium]